ncbi:hypothetical protein D3C73_752600 [compost metagenome]
MIGKQTGSGRTILPQMVNGSVPQLMQLIRMQVEISGSLHMVLCIFWTSMIYKREWIQLIDVL